MLLLVTIGLVGVAAIALAIGFLSNHLGPIYVSIACSAMAGIVLALFSRMSRRQVPVTVGAGPAPLSDFTTSAFQSRPSAPARPGISGTAPIPTLASLDEDDYEDETDNWADEPLFPIEDYDELRVADILPLLVELDLDELEQVQERESQGKARNTVLTRVRQLIAELEDLTADAAPAPAPAPKAPRSTAKSSSQAATATRKPPAKAADKPAPARRGRKAVAPARTFPIEGYEQLKAPDVMALLPELDDEELGLVAERERSGANRTTVLSRIERLLGSPVRTSTPPPRRPGRGNRPPAGS